MHPNTRTCTHFLSYLIKHLFFIDRLVGCDLNETDLEVVASALSSNPPHLKELDLSCTNLGKEDSLERLCAGLKSPQCGLEILR